MAAVPSASGLQRIASFEQLEPAGSAPKVKAKAKAKPTGTALMRPRVVRPRIDIDDQIAEANRVHDLLKKMSQAATKQRLIKKAARLNPADLERIAVLKRIFSEPADEQASTFSASSSSSSGSSSGHQGALDMHGTLRSMLKDVPGAEHVVMGLDAQIRNVQPSHLACEPNMANDVRRSSGDAVAAAAAHVRNQSCDHAEECLASEQADDMEHDDAVEAPPSPAA